jgi:tetratricopeptide (TPR) repeat protein
MDRLSAPQKELLQTLAVIGRKSPMGLLERVFPLPSSEVAPILAELQASEFIYEQPAANDVEYVFKHALTQEVAYNSLLVERRRGLHARAGEAIEEMYAERLDGHLVELAHHYSHSAITMKGVEYLYRVGEQTSARLPNQEAINYLIAALELLRSVPDCPERAQRELAIQLSLAGVWRSLNGWNAPEVESAYRRALVLTQDSEDPSAKAPAAIGLAFTYLTAGKERAAIELSTELAELASKTDDLGLLLRTLDCTGQAYWIMGDYLHGLGCMERLIALYRPGIRGWRPEYDYSAILAHRPQVLIESGFPARAVKSLREALAFAQTFDDKMAQIIAVEAAADVQFELRDTDGLFEYSSRLSALLEEVPNPLYIASCEALKGWALVRSGKFDEALKQVRRTHEIAGPVRSCFSFYSALVSAETCLEAKSVEEGLAVIAAIEATIQQSDIRLRLTELFRIKGELLNLRESAESSEPELCFREAIEIARKQGAKWFEMRATTSLARLLDKQDRRDEARTMLAEIYHWFTEGFDTTDLKDAKALLDQLGA